MLSDANVMRILRTHLQGRGMLESDLILHSVALCFGFWRLPALRRTAGLPDAESFLYGGAVSLEAETYLTDRLVLVLRLRERILWGGAASLFHTGFGVGIRYIL